MASKRKVSAFEMKVSQRTAVGKKQPYIQINDIMKEKNKSGKRKDMHSGGKVKVNDVKSKNQKKKLKKKIQKQNPSQNEVRPSKRLKTKEKEKNSSKKRKKIAGDENTDVSGTLDKSNMMSAPDSMTSSVKMLEWLIAPLDTAQFFNDMWEKKPVLIQRQSPDYYKGLFSSEEFDAILRKNDIQYSRNIDITSYTNGLRETHNPLGRAYAPVVWDYYKNDCSVRFLNPQSYSNSVWKLLTTLQDNFCSFVGANVYLTPPGSQGFAPHYDDIEAFILQLEGSKHWRVYKPRSEAETLPRLSSANFTDEDIGEPILDVTLGTGDLLYFPRGFIHQATTLEDTHSLHITISTYQKNTWYDFIQNTVAGALENAVEEDIEFRQSLPRDYLDYMGVINSDKEDVRRTVFISKFKELFMKLANHAPIDAAVDQMGKDLIHSSLPLPLNKAEKSCTVFGQGARCVNGKLFLETVLNEDTEVQLTRKSAFRMLTEGDSIQIYHCLENSRVYHEKEPQSFEIPAETAPGVEFLLHEYPSFVRIQDLPLEGEYAEKQVEFAQCLYEKGLIRTKYPLLEVEES